MPDIGTLNLTIESNASTAANGLKKLADKLELVKGAASGFDLSPVTKQITEIVNSVKGSEKTVAALGTLFNSIANFSKIKTPKIDVTPIERLKAAFGDGIKTGNVGSQLNQLREALEKEWKTENIKVASDALGKITKNAHNIDSTNLADVATSISATAKALNEYADAAERVKSVVGTSSGSKLDMTGFEQTEKGVWKFNPENARGSKLKLNLQFHGWREDMSGMSEASKQVEDASAKLESAKSSFDSLRELTDIFRQMKMTISGGIDLDAIITNLERLKEAGTGGFGLTTLVNSLTKLNASISETVSGGTIEGIRSLADALAQLKTSTDGLNIPNIKINFGGGGRRSRSRGEATDEGGIAETLGQVAEGMQSAFTSVESSISGIVQGAGELVGELIQINTVAGNAADEAERMARAFAELFRMASMARSASSLPWGGGYGLPEHGFVQGEGSVSGDENQLYLMGETASNAVETMNDAAEATKSYTAACEEALQAAIKLHREQAEKYATKDWSFEDVYYGTREKAMGKRSLMSEWLHGQGTEHEQTYALKSMAQQFGMTVDEVKQKIAELNATSPQVSEAFASVTQAMGMSKADLMQMKYEGMLQSAIEARQAGKMTEQQFAETIMRLQDYRDKLLEARAAQEGLSNSAGGLGGAIASFGAGIKRAFPALTGLINRFKNIVKYRMLRSVIRYITAGFSEGIQNVYKYSEAIGGSFAPAMDSAASAIATMKNSLGAALAPALQSLIPILNTLVSWFITLVNVVNQFFSLFRGQATWTKAVDAQTTAYKNNEKAAKGAGGAAKDLLADWDELNIIQSESGGGGGGGSGLGDDFENMFEEVSEFAGWIKDLVNGIKEQFGSIWNLVKRIGAILLAWKLSKAFTGIIGTLAGLAGAALTFDLIFKISSMLTGNYLKTGDKGWLVADVLSTLVGGYIAKALLKNVLAGSLASYAIPIAFGISAAATIIALIKDTDTSALSEKSILTALTGGIEGGVAAGSLFSLAGYSGIQSLGGGIGAALFTFGVAIGLKAIATKLDTGEFTPEIIQANFLSAGAIGGGLFLTELALGGGVVSALTLGGGAALLTLAALFAIEAIIQKEPAGIKWGDYKATKEEIESYVNDYLYEDPPTATVSKIKLVIDSLDDAKKQLITDTETAIGSINALSVGLLDNAPDTVRAQIDALVSSFNTGAEQYQNSLEVALSLVPKTGENGEEDTKDIIKTSSELWSELTGEMTRLGNELADAYKIAYDARIKGNVDETAETTVREISEMMQHVTEAIAKGQARAKVGNMLRMQMENLSKDTLDGILDAYKEQRDALIEELTKIREESAEGLLAQQYAFEEIAEYALEKAGGNLEDAEYKKWKDKADRARDNYLKYIEDTEAEVEKAAEKLLDKDEMERLQNVAQSLIEEGFDFSDYAPTLTDNLRDIYFSEIFDENGQATEGSKAAIQGWLDMMLESAFPKDYGTLKKILDNKIRSYGDYINAEAIDILADELGITGASPEIQKAWNDMINDLLYGGEGNYELGKNGIVIDVDADTSKAAEEMDELSDKIGKSAAEAAMPVIDITKAQVKEIATPLEEAKKAIQEALSADDVLGELNNVLMNFGPKLYNEALNELGIDLDKLEAVSEAKDMGAEIVAGAADAIDENADKAVSAAKAMAQDTIDGAKETLGIASPSREFMAIGEYCMEGLKSGLESYAGEVQATAEKIASGIVETFRNAISSLQEMNMLDSMQDLMSSADGMQWNIPNNMARAFSRSAMQAAGATAIPVMATPQYAQPMYAEQGGSNPVEIEDISGDVQRGVSAGNSEQNSLISQLISVCQRIAAKEFTVNISPSSTMGQTNARSDTMYTAVRGPV